MRKASREMDATFALEVLDKAPYVTVSKLTEGLTLCELLKTSFLFFFAKKA